MVSSISIKTIPLFSIGLVFAASLAVFTAKCFNMRKMMLILMGLGFMMASCSREVGRGFPKTTVYQPFKVKNGSNKIPSYKPPKWKGNDRTGPVIRYRKN
jgi:predicted membrane metal-binding protein